MKLSHTLTLILCLQTTLSHNAPWIEDQQNRDAVLLEAAAMTNSLLLMEAFSDLACGLHYHYKIKADGITGERIEKRDVALTSATINFATSASICIATKIYMLRDQIF
jgi:hypothetical protein